MFVVLKINLAVVGFNRYMVECECLKVLEVTRRTSVLIDTWWNVNFFCKHNIILLSLVLIDTWWNVNTIAVTRKRSNGVVLIDTWWNVNDIVLYPVHLNV